VHAEEDRGLLEDVGFSYDFIGDSDIALRSVPADLAQADPGEIFKTALDRLDENRGGNRDFIEEEVLYSMACKSSVKANTRLTDAEVQSLIRQLVKMDNPYTCPHGRPLAVKLRRKDLEKLFKRIV
jgi:DNA mismatch repair protein MutL